MSNPTSPPQRCDQQRILTVLKAANARLDQVLPVIRQLPAQELQLSLLQELALLELALQLPTLPFSVDSATNSSSESSYRQQFCSLKSPIQNCQSVALMP